MEPRTLQYIAEACGGRLAPSHAGVVAAGISTDSRRLQAGELFVALPGERHEGRRFVEAALRAGACGALLDDSDQRAAALPFPVISVRDARRALGLVASRYRADFIPAVIAIGGSNGKTTTKDLIAAILTRRWPAVWSEASYNNDIGVPLTLLQIERRHRAAVIETGTNHPGELAPLLNLVRPRFCVITNIGREHLEFFGSLEGVAREEGCMADVLSKNGILFLPGDSPWAETIARRTRARVVRAGHGPRNDWRMENVRPDETGVAFTVHAPAEAWSGEYRVPLLGRHQAMNALLALAVAAENHFTKAEIQAGLAACRAPKMRLQLKWIDGVGWLNDAYNSNPDSLAAAFETLAALPCAGRRFAVLGEMLEIGPSGEAAHFEAGRAAAAAGLDGIWAVGRWADRMVGGALEAGLGRATACADAREAAETLGHALQTRDLVLLKGSRGVGLEMVEEMWRQARGEPAASPAA